MSDALLGLPEGGLASLSRQAKGDHSAAFLFSSLEAYAASPERYNTEAKEKEESARRFFRRLAKLLYEVRGKPHTERPNLISHSLSPFPLSAHTHIERQRESHIWSLSLPLSLSLSLHTHTKKAYLIPLSSSLSLAVYSPIKGGTHFSSVVISLSFATRRCCVEVRRSALDKFEGYICGMPSTSAALSPRIAGAHTSRHPLRLLH
jgi:hypothetical protein